MIVRHIQWAGVIPLLRPGVLKYGPAGRRWVLGHFKHIKQINDADGFIFCQTQLSEKSKSNLYSIKVLIPQKAYLANFTK